MQVIVVKPQGGKAIYHDKSDVMGVLATVNEYLHAEQSKPAGEHTAVTIRFTVISDEYWDALPLAT